MRQREGNFLDPFGSPYLVAPFIIETTTMSMDKNWLIRVGHFSANCDKHIDGKPVYGRAMRCEKRRVWREDILEIIGEARGEATEWLSRKQ